MPDTPSPHYTPLALEIENQALRAELQRLRQDRITAEDHQALLDRYEQTQVRFRTVFEYSPLGQKIIAADLTICQANPALVVMIGFTHTSDVVGRKIMDFALCVARRLDSPAAESVGARNALLRLRNPAGTPKWLRVLVPSHLGALSRRGGRNGLYDPD
jgi:PAS domain-containing protein